MYPEDTEFVQELLATVDIEDLLASIASESNYIEQSLPLSTGQIDCWNTSNPGIITCMNTCIFKNTCFTSPCYNDPRCTYHMCTNEPLPSYCHSYTCQWCSTAGAEAQASGQMMIFEQGNIQTR